MMKHIFFLFVGLLFFINAELNVASLPNPSYWHLCRWHLSPKEQAGFVSLSKWRVHLVKTGDVICVEQYRDTVIDFFRNIHDSIKVPYILLTLPGLDGKYECTDKSWNYVDTDAIDRDVDSSNQEMYNQASILRHQLGHWFTSGKDCPGVVKFQSTHTFPDLSKINFAPKTCLPDAVNADSIRLVASAIHQYLNVWNAFPENIVMALAYGYTFLETYEVFVGSLRETGFNGEIVLGVSRGLSSKIERYLIENRVRIQYLDFNDAQTKQLFFLRFLLSAWWTELLAPLGRVLMVDFRDVLFQRNPFEDILPMTGGQYSPETYFQTTQLSKKNQNISESKDGLLVKKETYGGISAILYTFEENPKILIEDCEINRKWVKECVGQMTYAKISTQRILNCGTVMGNATGFTKWAKELSSGCSLENPSCDSFGCKGSDQALHNVLVYDGRLSAANIEVIIVPHGQGPVHNIGYFNEVPRDSSGYILGLDGRRAAVVHQYDRFEALKLWANIMWSPSTRLKYVGQVLMLRRRSGGSISEQVRAFCLEHCFEPWLCADDKLTLKLSTKPRGRVFETSLYHLATHSRDSMASEDELPQSWRASSSDLWGGVALDGDSLLLSDGSPLHVGRFILDDVTYDVTLSLKDANDLVLLGDDSSVDEQIVQKEFIAAVHRSIDREFNQMFHTMYASGRSIFGPEKWQESARKETIHKFRDPKKVFGWLRWLAKYLQSPFYIQLPTVSSLPTDGRMTTFNIDWSIQSVKATNKFSSLLGSDSNITSINSPQMCAASAKRLVLINSFLPLEESNKHRSGSDPFRLFVLSNAASDWRSDAIVKHRTPAPLTTSILEEILSQMVADAKPKNGKVLVINFGSGFGFHSQLSVAFGAYVISYDPNSMYRQIYRDSVVMQNRFTGGVTHKELLHACILADDMNIRGWPLCSCSIEKSGCSIGKCILEIPRNNKIQSSKIKHNSTDSGSVTLGAILIDSDRFLLKSNRTSLEYLRLIKSVLSDLSQNIIEAKYLFFSFTAPVPPGARRENMLNILLHNHRNETTKYKKNHNICAFDVSDVKNIADITGNINNAKPSRRACVRKTGGCWFLSGHHPVMNKRQIRFEHDISDKAIPSPLLRLFRGNGRRVILLAPLEFCSKMKMSIDNTNIKPNVCVSDSEGKCIKRY